MASLSTALMASTSAGRARSACRCGRRWWRPPLRREPRAEQRLADIDIAEAGDDALVAERGLQRGLLAGAGSRQHGGVEFIAERLRPERAQQRLLVELGARHQLHRAEAARIVEGDDGAVRHVKHHMVVRRALWSARDNIDPARCRGRAASSPTCRDASAARRPTTDPPADISPAGPGLRRSSRAAAFRSPWRSASAGRGGAPRPWRRRAPSIAGARPRRTVSTSGSSGMVNGAPAPSS